MIGGGTTYALYHAVPDPQYRVIVRPGPVRLRLLKMPESTGAGPMDAFFFKHSFTMTALTDPQL